MLTNLPTATRVNAKTWQSRSRSSAIQLDLRYAIIALRVFAIYRDANLPTAPKPDAVPRHSVTVLFAKRLGFSQSWVNLYRYHTVGTARVQCQYSMQMHQQPDLFATLPVEVRPTSKNNAPQRTSLTLTSALSAPHSSSPAISAFIRSPILRRVRGPSPRVPTPAPRLQIGTSHRARGLPLGALRRPTSYL